MQERYYKFSTYFKRKGFKERVHKVSVDAYFSCPNRDGKLSYEGCIYCDNKGFNINARKKDKASIRDQVENGIVNLQRRINAKKFIVYFQSYTNTYASVEELKKAYDNIRYFPDVIGIAIATRPDCIDEDILSLIASYGDKYELWIEYGIQTIHPKTLDFINRGHIYEEVIKAVKLTRKYKGINICGHIILGLPFETDDMMMDTAKAVAGLKLEGIKLHPLHVIRDTKLHELYNQSKIVFLGMDEYVNLAVKFLEYMWPETVIQRITADCPSDLLVAPLWISDKAKVLQAIEDKFLEENTFQGRLYEV